MSDVSPAFEAAAAALRRASFRPDLAVREIPSPSGVAPHSIAFAGDVRPDSHGDSPYGTGRFLLLHDPDEPESWGGPWRIVAFAQAPLELDIGTDPLLADVAWSWLTDALASHHAAYHSAAGTATKTVSRGFGSLAEQGDGSQVELRASWTPDPPSVRHIEAWAELVCMLAGLPPGSENIAILRPGLRPPRST
ncbi:hypothetical protein GCM10010910_04550 [Microbacterium nanhaiense]|uniref:DUF3000 domain-containing protein n=1 Tax=Microbacterium nanhaiense TaxID=1301026 RepID=A0ABQ2MYB2_9MICO|nr:DUF3000 domain-containing protein [Microbacterium nanhaiense]GGO60063.1 hypothetical protein GCM10010910_04550 [Microbacterium nanhaiense]